MGSVRRRHPLTLVHRTLPRQRMIKRIWALRASFAAALVVTLTMAWLPHPPSVPLNPPDKVQHVAAFLTLSLLATAAFPHAKLLRIGERLSFMGALIEVVQNIPALHRDCDIMDWLADTIAVAVALTLVWHWRRFRERRLKFDQEALKR